MVLGVEYKYAHIHVNTVLLCQKRNKLQRQQYLETVLGKVSKVSGKHDLDVNIGRVTAILPGLIPLPLYEGQHLLSLL